MNAVYKYKLRCLTENAWKEVILESEPTACPTNSGHTIDTNSISVVEKFEHVIVESRLKQYDLIDPDVARTCDRGFELEVHEGDLISTKVHVFPYNVDLICGQVQYNSPQPGDYIEVLGTPITDAPVGTLTQATIEGSTEVYVSNPAGYMFTSGIFLLFGAEEKEYRVVSTDGTIVTLEEPIVGGHDVDEPVRLHRKFLEKFWIVNSNRTPIAENVQDAAGMSPMTQIVTKYYHKVAAAQDGVVRLWLTYRY